MELLVWSEEAGASNDSKAASENEEGVGVDGS